MRYEEYFRKFNSNDNETIKNHIPNDRAEEFLLKNAPRLYCPDSVIEETFAFRTWTMRKHIRKTPEGFVITEFLPDVSWAGKYNTINCPLFHHLREFRWLKSADDYLDYITFFLKGEGSRYSYHDPALAAMYDFCVLTGNEQYLKDNVTAFEAYFDGWKKEHYTENGLYTSVDNREGTEYSISGTTPEFKMLSGFRPLMNGCMYGDAAALAKIERLSGREDMAARYEAAAEAIKQAMDEKMWDGDFYKAVHPLHQELDRPCDFNDIPKEQNVRELVGYVPWIYAMPDEGKEKAFIYLKDSSVFKAKTGFATADISHPRFLYDVSGRGCTWNGKVWPFATSLVLSAVITLLSEYKQSVISDSDLYGFTKTYAEMHYLEEDGRRVNFIDEVMLPFDYVWDVHEKYRQFGYIPSERGGKDRGKDYNHSTFIDIVLRGLCGVDDKADELCVAPRIRGIWKWFKIENLTYKKKTYNVYYDEDGSVFGKGCGVRIEEII